MMKTCASCASNFEITDGDLEFYAKIGPVSGSVKFSIDPPKLCPPCRDQRRLAMRNERHLYPRTSSLSGQKLITIYSPDKPFKLLSFEEWFSDKWDAMNFGRDFDFGRPFFEQFKELREAVPRNSSNIWQSQNCDFCTYTDFSKNCYLVFAGSNCKDTYYSNLVEGVSDSIDVTGCNLCELCFDCVDCIGCNSAVGCLKCENSHTLAFCFDCRNCEECLFSFNLSHKKYCIWNKQYSKEEYLAQKGQLNIVDAAAYTKYKGQFMKTCESSAIHRHAKIVNCENCTGDNLKNCKNAHDCFDSNNLNDCSYVNFSSNSRDAYDVIGSSSKGCELTCEAMSIEGQNIFVGYYIAGLTDIYYSDTVISCKNVFGCVGTKHKEYCILNKQYSKEEYEKLVPRIIEHMKKENSWGEFFPISISPFAYNETVAQEYFPIEKAEAIGKGYLWKKFDEDSPATSVAPANENISSCKSCKKYFRLIPQELELYKKLNVPRPKECPDCRHAHRQILRNPCRLYSRKCDKCAVGIQTSYSPNNPAKVCCKKCYLETV